MLLTELIEALPIEADGRVDGVSIAGLVDDSRVVKPGDLFIARPGSVTDGRRFIADAVARGAAAVVVDQAVQAAGAVVLRAADVPQATIDLARRFHGDPAGKLKLIGVTGTNGKTTMTYMVRHLLAAAGQRCGLIGTVEIDDGREVRLSNLTTPGVIELMELLAGMVRGGCGACVMEVSSHALDQGRVRGLNFAVAAFTNLTGDHLDYHKTMDAYGAAKAKLFESLEPGAMAVINADDAAAYTMLRDCKARRLTYGTVPGVDCRTSIHEITARDTECSFDGPWGSLRVKLPLIGRHNVANMAAALGCVHALGVDVAKVRDAVERCPQVPGRLERVECGEVAKSRSGDGQWRDVSFDVLVDYAHTDDALGNVLRALRPVTGGRLRVMFGCGGDRDATKRPRMAKVACELADDVVITSDNPRTEDPKRIIDQIFAGVPVKATARVAIEVDRAAAIERIIREAEPGDVVLLAGKGHEDYQIIGTEKRPFDDRAIARQVLVQLVTGARKTTRAGSVDYSEARRRIAELIEAPLDTSGGKREVRYAPVGAREAAAVKSIHGLDVTGFEHAIDKSAVNHILKSHGTAAEWRKGHIPVTGDDIKLMPQIVTFPDEIVDGLSKRADMPTIRYCKQFSGVTYFVEEVRTGMENKTLAAVTMWKVASGAKDFPAVGGRPHTPEATPESPPQQSIVEPIRPFHTGDGIAAMAL